MIPEQVRLAEEKADELLKAQAEPEKVEPTPESQPEKPEEETPDLKAQLEAAEHKYKVLQGKYNKEIVAIKDDVNLLNRLKGENDTLRRQVQKLESDHEQTSTLLTELRQELDKRKEPEILDPAKVLSEEDLQHLKDEDLDGKTIEIFMKLANSVRDKNLESKVSEISKEVSDVKKDFETSRVQTWEEKVNARIPDFASYVGPNADPDFAEWLNQPLSEFSARTRRDELQDALNSRNLEALAKGIDLFKATKKEPQSNPLEKHIDPDETIAPDPKPVKEGKIWQMKDVIKFYSDQTKGLYRGREKEAAAIDQEIIRADREGRIMK